MSNLVVQQTNALAKQLGISGDDAELLSVLCVISRHVSISEAGCWEWTGALNGTGYGQLTYKGKHMTAHRFSFSALVEPIRDGMWVLHHCDNRRCVNPRHLYQGTPIDNRADALNRNRWANPLAARTACGRGHSYANGEYRIASDGSRECRVCNREYKRAYRAARKVA